jgi:geranylgeranyl diphosphate synthase, type I
MTLGIPIRDPGFEAAVESELETVLSERRDAILASACEATSLIDEIGRLISSGGKRLRPLFCYWGFRAGRGRDRAALARVGAALELLHAAALIHDDVIDHSMVRRGQPASHVQLAIDGDGTEDYGRAAAILAGDLAQALSADLLCRAAFPARRVTAALVLFNEMRIEATCGELLDRLATGRSGRDNACAERASLLKSSSYTVLGPLLIGATLAGAEAEAVAALEGYGRPLGKAFQIRDDIISTFGDPELTGKDRDNDLREGKRTAVTEAFWQVGSEQAQRLVSRRLGGPHLTTDEITSIRAVISDSGAVEEASAIAWSLAEQAKDALSAATLPGDAAEGLAALADYVAQRNT